MLPTPARTATVLASSFFKINTNIIKGKKLFCIIFIFERSAKYREGPARLDRISEVTFHLLTLGKSIKKKTVKKKTIRFSGFV